MKFLFRMLFMSMIVLFSIFSGLLGYKAGQAFGKAIIPGSSAQKPKSETVREMSVGILTGMNGTANFSYEGKRYLTIKDFYPSLNQKGVPVDARPAVYLADRPDGNVSPGKGLLRSSRESIEGVFHYDAEKNALIFEPGKTLEPFTEYEMLFKKPPVDSRGARLENTGRWRFMTGPERPANNQRQPGLEKKNKNSLSSS